MQQSYYIPPTAKTSAFPWHVVEPMAMWSVISASDTVHIPLLTADRLLSSVLAAQAHLLWNVFPGMRFTTAFGIPISCGALGLRHPIVPNATLGSKLPRQRVYTRYWLSKRSSCSWLDNGQVFICVFVDRDRAKDNKNAKNNQANIQPSWLNKLFQ